MSKESMLGGGGGGRRGEELYIFIVQIVFFFASERSNILNQVIPFYVVYSIFCVCFLCNC